VSKCNCSSQELDFWFLRSVTTRPAGLRWDEDGKRNDDAEWRYPLVVGLAGVGRGAFGVLPAHGRRVLSVALHAELAAEPHRVVCPHTHTHFIIHCIIHTYIPLTPYPRRGTRGISDIIPRRPRFTKPRRTTFYQNYLTKRKYCKRQVTGGKPIAV
jgi:hypothetical protein